MTAARLLRACAWRIPALKRAAAFALAALLLPLAAWPFTLDELRAQLTAAQVVRGDFVQEKHLRSLPQPLVSRGDFVLAAGLGLLWELKTPIAQSLRITPRDVSRRLPQGGWQPVPNANGRESRLFLALLAGDTEGLAQNFALDLQGDANDWRMTMTPNSAILRQIFTDIEIQGGALVRRIELREVQGDRTVLQLQNAQVGDSLSDDERRAYQD